MSSGLVGWWTVLEKMLTLLLSLPGHPTRGRTKSWSYSSEPNCSWLLGICCRPSFRRWYRQTHQPRRGAGRLRLWWIQPQAKTLRRFPIPKCLNSIKPLIYSKSPSVGHFCSNKFISPLKSNATYTSLFRKDSRLSVNISPISVA